MSEACARYFAPQAQLLRFIGLVAAQSARIDEMRRIAAEALNEVGEGAASPAADPPTADRASAQAALDEFRPFMREMTLTRAVDNFLAYVVELLATVFRSRPETLKSDEQIALAAVLDHDSMESLIQELAERRVEVLTYRSLSDLSGYLSKRLGFELFPTRDERDRAQELVEYRNAITHNRAVVGRAFIRRMPHSDYALGDRLRVRADDIFDGIENLNHVVSSADARAAEKWGLGRAVPVSELANYAPGAGARSSRET